MPSIIDKLTLKEAGRKFRAFLICIAAATGAFALAAVYPTLVPILAVYLTALGGFLSIYVGGNVIQKHVLKKNGAVVLPGDDAEDTYGSTQ